MKTIIIYFSSSCLSSACWLQWKKSKDTPVPNILFAISDDQSFAHTSFAGSNFVNTPAFRPGGPRRCLFHHLHCRFARMCAFTQFTCYGRHHWQNEQSGQHASSWLKNMFRLLTCLMPTVMLPAGLGKVFPRFGMLRMKTIRYGALPMLPALPTATFVTKKERRTMSARQSTSAM
jgi:hypothetical protein